MSQKAQLLAETVNNSRELTRDYLSRMKAVDVYKTFKLDEKILNPVIWEIGHLAVSQNWLLLYLGHGEAERIEWAKLFGMGVSLPKKEEYPPYEDIWSTFKTVHDKSVAHILSLSDKDLQKEPKKEIPFIRENNVKNLIMHSIRHEGIHAGHLSWLCKLHGIKTY